jgi:Transposase DDE domain
MNDVFTQVVELARSAGLGKLGHVAIDSTRIAANAARDSVETMEKLRAERAKIRKRIRRWQQQCDGEAPNEGPGTALAREEMGKLEERLQQIPRRIERLKKSGMKKLSRVDEDSRFLRDRQGFTLGYTATLGVSEDHLIVAQQVGQASTDNDLPVPLVDQVERQCGERPAEVSADSGFFSLDNLHAMEERKIEAYVPDTNLARVLNRGGKLKQRACDRAHRRMRRKLRSPDGRRRYRRRREVVEPVWGVLKEQRGMRGFACAGWLKWRSSSPSQPRR